MKEIQELRFEMKLLEKQVKVIWKHIENIKVDISKVQENNKKN